MVSGCFVNAVDSFQVQEWKAAQSKQPDALSRWLPVKMSTAGNTTFPSRDDSMSTVDTKLHDTSWASSVAHRVAVAQHDPQLCVLNPTFDASDQSSFNADAVDLVVQRGNDVLFGGGIDFVGVQEQWDTSLALLAKMFSIPVDLLDAAKKVTK